MYDDNGEEYSQEDIRRMQNEARVKSGIRNAAGGLSHAISAYDRKDVEAVKNRKGKNEGHGRPKDEDEEEESKKKDSSLEEKEGLEDKKDKEEKDGKEDKDNKKDKKDDKDDKKGLLDKAKKEGFIKSKWKSLVLKAKIALVALGIVLAIAVIVIISSALTLAVDAFKNAVTNFFGIPDKTIKIDGTEVDGLYSEKYLYDDDGNLLNAEDLVNTLKSTDRCGGTNAAARTWNNVMDAITNFMGKEGMSVCKFMREIKRQTDGTDLDRSLIISTVFYGFATQPNNVDYRDTGSIPDDKIDASNHYEILESVLKDKENGFRKSNLDDVIKYMKTTNEKYYYVWKVETDDDEVVGKCEKTPAPTKLYNLNKWKVFMRFGQRAADEYDKFDSIVYAFSSSDEECIGEKTEEELLEMLENSIAEDPDKEDITVKLDKSVTKAINELKGTRLENINSFLQYADINTKTKDIFSSFNGITFDYRYGYAYNNFLGYKKSKLAEPYDEIYTPKYVETTIQEIISKKKDLNSALLFEDPDDPDTFSDNDTTGRIKTGRCGDYLSVGYDEIDVRLTDCYGKEIRTVSFEEYIIGVANGEVSDRSEDYVLSEMLAAMSYALHRHNNYTKGKLITMRSGTCDQVYCPMKEGCYSVANPDICSGCASYYPGGGKKYPGLYSKYQAYYAKAAAYLVVSNGHPHNCHYVSSIQNQWASKAAQGMPFTQIIQETYEKEGAQVVKCSDLNKPVETPETDPSLEKVGNKKTDEYPNVAPDLGDFYGFAYKNLAEDKRIEINPEWEKANLTTITPDCKDTEFGKMQFTVHRKAVNAFDKAFKGVCKLLTEGVTLKDGSKCKYTMDDLKDGSTYVARKTTNGAIDIHSYGIAQDWNYSKKIVVDGKEYMPYSVSRELSDYFDFIEAIGGNEENCKNINYILWLKAYKDAGFEWGGNFGRNGNSGQFDGKLFQLKYK